jgi:hypothetical protein
MVTSQCRHASTPWPNSRAAGVHKLVLGGGEGDGTEEAAAIDQGFDTSWMLATTVDLYLGHEGAHPAGYHGVHQGSRVKYSCCVC